VRSSPAVGLYAYTLNKIPFGTGCNPIFCCRYGRAVMTVSQEQFCFVHEWIRGIYWTVLEFLMLTPHHPSWQVLGIVWCRSLHFTRPRTVLGHRPMYYSDRLLSETLRIGGPVVSWRSSMRELGQDSAILRAPRCQIDVRSLASETNSNTKDRVRCLSNLLTHS